MLKQHGGRKSVGGISRHSVQINDIGSRFSICDTAGRTSNSSRVFGESFNVMLQTLMAGGSFCWMLMWTAHIVRVWYIFHCVFSRCVHFARHCSVADEEILGIGLAWNILWPICIHGSVLPYAVCICTIDWLLICTSYAVSLTSSPVQCWCWFIFLRCKAASNALWKKLTARRDHPVYDDVFNQVPPQLQSCKPVYLPPAGGRTSCSCSYTTCFICVIAGVS